MKNGSLDMIARVLVIIGGLNWGLIGIDSSLNIVNMVFGGMAWLEQVIYILVGLAALYLLVGMFKKR